MQVLILLAAFGAALAVPPQWYNGICGQSKYPSAGTNCSIDAFACSRISTRIKGGIDASPGEFPWLVSLRDNTDNYAHKCMGAIINEQWILTSGSCLWLGFGNAMSNIQAVVGAQLLDANAPNEANHTIQGLLPNEEYEYSSGPNSFDVALLKTTTPMTMSEDVTPICAPDPDVSYVGQDDYSIAGWGATGDSGPDTTNILQWASVASFSQTYCSGQYTSYPASGLLCAAEIGQQDNKRGFCLNDLGTPLAYKGSDGAFTVAGIASYQFRCADGAPGVYTDASFSDIIDWITTKIEKN